MKHALSRLFLLALSVICALTLLNGCDVDNENKASDDIAAFSNLVDIDLSVTSIKWEVFGTPEYSGGVPGPTDFLTLIAEVTPPAKTAIARPSKVELVWIAPEAPRPWLSPTFRTMLAKYRNTSIDPSSLAECRVLEGKLRKTGKPVKGFICSYEEASFIYMTLADYTAP